MEPKLFYSIAETNHQITHKEVFFNPRGMCVFKGELEYRFGNLVSKVILESGKKTTRQKFAVFTQKHLNDTEKEFIAKVTALRLEAVLSGDAALLESLNNEPIHGSYKAYVVE